MQAYIRVFPKMLYCTWTVGCQKFVQYIHMYVMLRMFYFERYCTYSNTFIGQCLSRIEKSMACLHMFALSHQALLCLTLLFRRQKNLATVVYFPHVRKAKYIKNTYNRYILMYWRSLSLYASSAEQNFLAGQPSKFSWMLLGKPFYYILFIVLLS